MAAAHLGQARACSLTDTGRVWGMVRSLDAAYGLLLRASAAVGSNSN